MLCDVVSGYKSFSGKILLWFDVFCKNEVLPSQFVYATHAIVHATHICILKIKFALAVCLCDAYEVYATHKQAIVGSVLLKVSLCDAWYMYATHTLLFSGRATHAR